MDCIRYYSIFLNYLYCVASGIMTDSGYSPFYILYIAINIAGLTYALGALFYGLPIPIYGLKKWGPKMMSDAIYAAVWINIYGAVISVIGKLQSLLGVSWTTFYSSILQLQVQMFNALIQIKSVYYIITTVKISMALALLADPVLQFSSFVTDIIFLLQFFIDLGEFIQSTFMILIAIGILLLSLPFRIGKNIGGTLISSSIVFYIGLPYLPIFMQNMSSSTLSQMEAQLSSIANLNTLIETVAGIVPELVIAFIIVPMLYLSILAGLSLGLGTAIGGSSGRMPFPLDLF
ncbi:DNA import protein CedA [Sulfolobus tengchongensis]|uniref:DNA import protein CedA n=1 Tax=Sulfolobus tengchongensis TaxID=207809 RepID=A0AAX4L0H0_9CREN